MIYMYSLYIQRICYKEYICIFFEVAIESKPEWDLNPRPLNSVQTL